MKPILSDEFLQWYEGADLSKITILDLWAAWCAGRASLYLEVEQYAQDDKPLQTQKIQ